MSYYGTAVESIVPPASCFSEFITELQHRLRELSSLSAFWQQTQVTGLTFLQDDDELFSLCLLKYFEHRPRVNECLTAELHMFESIYFMSSKNYVPL